MQTSSGGDDDDDDDDVCRQVESAVHRRPVSTLGISSAQRQLTALQKICKVTHDTFYV